MLQFWYPGCNVPAGGDAEEAITSDKQYYWQLWSDMQQQVGVDQDQVDVSTNAPESGDEVGTGQSLDDVGSDGDILHENVDDEGNNLDASNEMSQKAVPEVMDANGQVSAEEDNADQCDPIT